MKHVFVETNWLVSCLAPAHQKLPDALALLDRAKSGELTLHVPAICVAECKRPIREKFQVKGQTDGVRKFLSWARPDKIVRPEEEELIRRTLIQMEVSVKRDLDRLDDSLNELCEAKGVEIFHISEPMWLKNTELSRVGLVLQPFDQAILASILIRAETLRKEGVPQFSFCETDSDLQPWDKIGEAKQPLAGLYDEAAIWVYRDFLMQRPPMPQSWPSLVQATIV